MRHSRDGTNVTIFNLSLSFSYYMLSLFIFAILLELYIDITNEIIVKIYIINAYNLYIVQSSDKSIVKKEGFFT